MPLAKLNSPRLVRCPAGLGAAGDPLGVCLGVLRARGRPGKALFGRPGQSLQPSSWSPESSCGGAWGAAWLTQGRGSPETAAPATRRLPLPAGQPLGNPSGGNTPAMHRAHFILALLACALACANATHSPSRRSPARRLLQTGGAVGLADELFDPWGESCARTYWAFLFCQSVSRGACTCCATA